MSYLVHLQQFEGPLGLLLYLIRKEEMDIFDINVGEITRQYLDYIRLMKELDLEVAGEFVAMAATLIHIKSRMLLPQYGEQGEAVEAVDDPRQELVQKLLEYQKYQEASKQLYERPLLGRDVFVRGLREDLSGGDPGQVITEDDGLFSLIAAYRRVVRKAQRAVHKVRPKVLSIALRILEVKDRLKVGARTVMASLISEHGEFRRAQLLITFLSMLELGRMGFVSVFQNEIYGDIYIDLKKPIDRNVLERVQEFETGDAEAAAASMINEAVEQKEDERIDLAEIMAEAEAERVSALAREVSASDAANEVAQLNLELDQEFGPQQGLEALEGIGASELASSEFATMNDREMDQGGVEVGFGMATDDEILAAENELDAHDAQILSSFSDSSEPEAAV